MVAHASKKSQCIVIIFECMCKTSNLAKYYGTMKRVTKRAAAFFNCSFHMTESSLNLQLTVYALTSQLMCHFAS